MVSLRQQIDREEFDYPALMDALSGYGNPRSKVTALLRKGDIIRVKKGLYIFGDHLRRRPYSRMLLANLLYGPSLVSHDSALSFHGLIPERVEVMTSATTRRSKTFDTPVGRFSYRQVPREYFHIGMDRMEERDLAFLIAVPERALADKILDDRGHPLRSRIDAKRYLMDDLRLDREELVRLDPELLDLLAKVGRSRKIAVCASLLRKLKEDG